MPRKRKVEPILNVPTSGGLTRPSKPSKPNFIVPSLSVSSKTKKPAINSGLLFFDLLASSKPTKRRGKKESTGVKFFTLAFVFGFLGITSASQPEVSSVLIFLALVCCAVPILGIASAIYPSWLKLLVKQFRQPNLVLAEIDSMPGHQFEEFVGELFRRQGYRVEVTKRSRDQGADILLQLNGRRIVVQTKRQSTKVGNWAVQEIVASKRIYNANEAMVVSNSDFTSPAIDLAEANGVQLVNRRELEQMLVQLKTLQ